MNIETGILVKVIACDNPRMEHMIGYIGHVKRPDYNHANHWIISGADKNIFGKICCWHTSHLQPLSDHRKTTWEEFDTIGWNPSRVAECR